MFATVGVSAMADTDGVDEMDFQSEEFDNGRPWENYECEANNARRSGPYLGTGATEREAQLDALAICRRATIIRCWIVPGSCRRIR